MLLENTLRFLTAVVRPKPTFTIPPSDPDPIHNFSMRDRNSSKNLSSYPSGNSITSWSSSQRQPQATSTPHRPNNSCHCACHSKSRSASQPSTSTDPLNLPCSRSNQRLPKPSPHRREPSFRDTPAQSLSTVKIQPLATLVGRSSRSKEKQAIPVLVSEMGELPSKSRTTAGNVTVDESSKMSEFYSLRPLKRTKTKPKRSSKTRIPSLRSESVKHSKISLGVKIVHRSSTWTGQKKKSNTSAAAARSSFLSLKDKTSSIRIVRKRDGTTIFVNRFGWPSKSAKERTAPTRKPVPADSNQHDSAGSTAVTQTRNRRPRSRPSFETGLSPIIEDLPSFPSLDDVDSQVDPFMVDSNEDGENSDQRHDDDSRNLEHMNLSGSFVLQTASFRNLRDGSSCASGDEPEFLPALVLTFPTPEPPRSPVLPTPLNAEEALATSINMTLCIPSLPRCAHCGFGFGLDIQDLELPLSTKPCRHCEAQWSACKRWSQGSTHRARLEDTLNVLALPEQQVGELGQWNRIRPVGHRSEEVYASFSNVFIRDRSPRTVWKKVARFFSSKRPDLS